jgi:hypothetical protein
MGNANKLYLCGIGTLRCRSHLAGNGPTDSPTKRCKGCGDHRCINQAHREFPGGESQDMQRSDAYEACMASLGFQP